MSKTFKEVAHLYLGCTIQHFHGTTFLCAVDLPYIKNDTLPIKPILHRLEDMTFKDICSLYSYQDKIFISETTCHKYTVFYYKWVHEDKDRNLADGYSYSSICTPLINSKFSVNELTFLLSKHYDLFNLIDNGQAIDAKTLNHE